MTKLVLSLAGSYLSGLLHFLALFPDNSVLGITETLGLDDKTAALLQVVLAHTPLSCFLRTYANLQICVCVRRDVLGDTSLPNKENLKIRGGSI